MNVLRYDEITDLLSLDAPAGIDALVLGESKLIESLAHETYCKDGKVLAWLLAYNVIAIAQDLNCITSVQASRLFDKRRQRRSEAREYKQRMILTEELRPTPLTQFVSEEISGRDKSVQPFGFKPAYFSGPSAWKYLVKRLTGVEVFTTSVIDEEVYQYFLQQLEHIDDMLIERISKYSAVRWEDLYTPSIFSKLSTKDKKRFQFQFSTVKLRSKTVPAETFRYIAESTGQRVIGVLGQFPDSRVIDILDLDK